MVVVVAREVAGAEEKAEVEAGAQAAVEQLTFLIPEVVLEEFVQGRPWQNFYLIHSKLVLDRYKILYDT